MSYESASEFVSTFAPMMKTRGSGHIINVLVSSHDFTSGYSRTVNNSDLASLQQSLSAYTVSARHGLTNSPIRVTAVVSTQNEIRHGQAPRLDVDDIADQVVFCATRAKTVQFADVMSHPAGDMPPSHPYQQEHQESSSIMMYQQEKQMG